MTRHGHNMKTLEVLSNIASKYMYLVSFLGPRTFRSQHSL